MNSRRILKLLVFGACLVFTALPVAIAWIEKKLGGREGFFITFAQLLALFPGPAGVHLRAAYYFGTLDVCTWEIHLGFGSIFTHRGARLGRNISTGSYCVLGHAAIEDGVRMASRVSVPSGKRQHVDDMGVLYDGTRFDTVSIGRDTWVGEGAVLLANVGRRCIVSAGAVVVNGMPDACIIGGNPAKVLRLLADHGDVEGAG